MAAKRSAAVALFACAASASALGAFALATGCGEVVSGASNASSPGDDGGAGAFGGGAEAKCGAGRIDTTFGQGGVAVIPGFSPLAAAYDPRGQIVVAGTKDNVSTLVRLRANGSLDPTFGQGGVAESLPADGGAGAIEAIAVQGDGAIVAVEATTSPGFALARYATNGAIDSTFGDDGRVTTPFIPRQGVNNFGVYATTVTVLRDGRILVAGNGSGFELTSRELGDYYGAYARYTATGGLEPSFAMGGTLLVDGLQATTPIALADGTVLLAGTYVAAQHAAGPAYYVGFGQLSASGELALVPNAFGGTGKGTASVDANENTIIAASFTDIADPTQVGTGFARATRSGDVDKGVIDDPKVLQALGTNLLGAFAQPDLRVVVVTALGLTRFNINGKMDATFGRDGSMTTLFSTNGAFTGAVAIGKGCDVVVAGVHAPSGKPSGGVVRFTQ